MAIILNSRDTIQERNQYQLDRLFGTYVSDFVRTATEKHKTDTQFHWKISRGSVNTFNY